jgi:hypothetical protein
MAYLDCPSATI